MDSGNGPLDRAGARSASVALGRSHPARIPPTRGGMAHGADRDQRPGAGDPIRQRPGHRARRRRGPLSLRARVRRHQLLLLLAAGEAAASDHCARVAPGDRGCAPGTCIPTSSMSRLCAGCLAAAVAITLAYANHFRNSFHFDDSHTVESNLFIRDLRNIPRFFTDVRTFSSLPSNQSYRPVVTTTLAVDYALGGLDPLPFHVDSFAWFLLECLLLAALSSTAIGGPSSAPRCSGCIRRTPRRSIT